MLPIIWTAHLQNNPDAKADLEKAIRNSTAALSRLNEILKEKEDSLDRRELSITTYGSPSYPFEQAHQNGRRACLREIKDLFAFLI